MFHGPQEFLVFTPNRTSIRPAVFKRRRGVMDRLTDASRYGNIGRKSPHLMHSMRPSNQDLNYFYFISLQHTCPSSSHNGDLFRSFDAERHSVENKGKIVPVAQSHVNELNSSFVRPLTGNVERTGHFVAFFWQILKRVLC